MSNLPTKRRIACGGLVTNLQPDIYAVVESSDFVQNSMETELFKEIETKVEAFSECAGRFVSQLQFCLAPVDAFVEPAIVVPNIGGNNNSYLWVQHPGDWSGMFVKWLKDMHNNKELRGNGELESDDEVSVASEADDVADDDVSLPEVPEFLDQHAPTRNCSR